MSSKLKIFTTIPKPDFVPVISGYSAADYFPLDLSVNNQELHAVDTASAEAIQQYIEDKKVQWGKSVAYGGYLERRTIYDRSPYFTTSTAAQRRDIHLGLDLWCPAKSVVLAPVAGSVHSYKDNTNYGDYGPCLILEHQANGIKFYTLYGHLSRQSLEKIEPGQRFKKGQPLGELGFSFENGDYAPHLHFQVILDIGESRGDYPGVCALAHLDFYEANCPDPNLLLHL